MILIINSDKYEIYYPDVFLMEEEGKYKDYEGLATIESKRFISNYLFWI